MNYDWHEHLAALLIFTYFTSPITQSCFNTGKIKDTFWTTPPLLKSSLCIHRVVPVCFQCLFQRQKETAILDLHLYWIYTFQILPLWEEGKNFKLFKFSSFTALCLRGSYRSMVLHVAWFTDWLVIHHYVDFSSQNAVTVKTAEVFQMPVLTFCLSIFIAEY